MTSSTHRRMFKKLPPPATFVRRLLGSVAVAGAVVGACLGLGILGYHAFARLPWIDALLNAAMILTGMGPVDPMITTSAKLFASFYALFSGVAFITTMGILLAPLVHRFLHRFHLEVIDDAPDEPPAAPAAGAQPGARTGP